MEKIYFNSNKDYYQILKVSPNATRDEIMKSYRNLIQLLMQDKERDWVKFAIPELQEAKIVLSNSNTREAYNKARGITSQQINYSSIPFDTQKNYYQTVNVSPNASKNEILSSCNKLKQILEPDKDKPWAKAAFNDINEAQTILTDDNKRAAYDNEKKKYDRPNSKDFANKIKDNIFNSYDNDNNNDDYNIKVDNQEENSETANNGREFLKKKKMAFVAYIVMATTLGTALILKGCKANKVEAASPEIVSPTPIVTSEPTNTPTNTPTPTAITNEAIAQNFYNTLTNYRNSGLNDLAPDITSLDDAKDLVNWANHINPEDYQITNAQASSTLMNYAFECAQHGIKCNISDLFQNNKDCQLINDLEASYNSIDQNNNSYDDEYKTYQQIQSTINNYDKSSISEAVAIDAINQGYIDTIETLTIIRGGNKTDNQESQEYLADKLSEINSTDAIEYCQDVYSYVNCNSSNYAFSEIFQQAIDEDNSKYQNAR